MGTGGLFYFLWSAEARSRDYFSQTLSVVYDRFVKIGEDDEGGAAVEAEAEIFMFVEDDGGEDHAVERFEIDRHVGGVGAEMFKNVIMPSVAKSGTDEGESEKWRPIVAGGPSELEMRAGDEGEAGDGGRTGDGHFVEQQGASGDALTHEGAVPNGKDGGKKGAKKTDEESDEVVKFYADDDDESGENDDAEDDFLAKGGAFFMPGFGEGGEKRDGGHGGKRDRDVGEEDGSEKADPVQADDRSGSENEGNLFTVGEF